VGVTYLLDTHVFLWLLGEPDRLPEEILDELEDDETRLLVSAASAMEIATKVRIGKLPGGNAVVVGWAERLAELDAAEIPITPRHALLAGSLDWAHRDPFDRLLAAQSLVENVPLLTADTAMASLPVLATRW
jgi:PIN domain nuclease of toxin-antitoxin system